LEEFKIERYQDNMEVVDSLIHSIEGDIEKYKAHIADEKRNFNNCLTDQRIVNKFKIRDFIYWIRRKMWQNDWNKISESITTKRRRKGLFTVIKTNDVGKTKKNVVKKVVEEEENQNS